MTPGTRSELDLQGGARSATTPPGNNRLDPILLLGASLALGGTAVTHPGWLAVSVSTLLVLTWRYTGWGVRALILACALFGAVQARHQVSEHQRAWRLARQWVIPGARCTGRGEVRSSPVLRGDRLTVTARLELECDGTP
ncbi:MAG: hypothetical protein KC766_37500, partial [Myxococcales bacterium]|nr:hypothetical protein [Myxococcales bacterium]